MSRVPEGSWEMILTLALAGGFKSAHLERLREHFGSLEEAFRAPAEAWAELDRADGELFRRAAKLRGSEQVAGVRERIGKGEFGFLSLTEEEFPRLLREIPAAPIGLFFMGRLELLSQPGVAVVGTRSPDAYGRRVARELGRELSEQGVVVVSGMAYGIDSEAHRGALEGEGLTVAVLGTGIDRPYPAELYGLYREIAERGLVVSEYPPGTPGSRYTFPERNRIIAGLSLGVVVVQGPADSGALITAGHALEQGREVMAVPGLITNPRSGGCHKLIKQGAHLVESAGDVLSVVGIRSRGEREREAVELSERERRVLQAVSYQGTHINLIARQLRMEVGEVSAVLSVLEVMGLVEQLPGGFYQRLA